LTSKESRAVLREAVGKVLMEVGNSLAAYSTSRAVRGGAGRKVHTDVVCNSLAAYSTVEQLEPLFQLG